MLYEEKNIKAIYTEDTCIPDLSATYGLETYFNATVLMECNCQRVLIDRNVENENRQWWLYQLGLIEL